jgi:hypothetical protein
MSDTVKLIIEIPKAEYELIVGDEACGLNPLTRAIAHGIPLDSNDSDYAEAQAYFDGQAYGWDEGRKALIDDVKTEIKALSNANPSYWHSGDMVEREEVLEIIDSIGEGTANES